MRNILLLIPELGGSALEQDLPHLRRLSEVGEVVRLAPTPPEVTPESLYLGAFPGEIRLAEGPLTVAWLRARPPEWSLQFALSVMSLQHGVVQSLSSLEVPSEIADQVAKLCRALNTKLLTVVAATEGLEHALVLEKAGDLRTYRPEETAGKVPQLPEGDFEPMLRRFIDDSINLLTEQEFNLRRVDQGLPPVNLLWPWGHGYLGKVPTLSLRRGFPLRVHSNSRRLTGLARLVGDWPEAASFGAGLKTNFDALAQLMALPGDRVFYLDGPQSLGSEQEEERAWWAHTLDRKVLAPILESPDWRDTQIALLAPRASGEGLGVLANGEVDAGNTAPFRDEVREDRKVRRVDLDGTVREFHRQRLQSSSA